MFFRLFFVWVPIFDPTLVQYFIQIPHKIFCCPLSAYDKWWFEQKTSPHFREKYLVLSYLNSWSPAGVLYKALKSNSNSAWATINKINRQAAALRCSSLCRIATPCQDLASKDSIDSEKINQLYSTKAQRVPEKCKIGKLGYVVSALLWQFDTIRNDLSGYGVYTKTMAYRFRIVFKSFHFLYRLRIVFKSLRIRIVFV